ncbi:hypothetical protein K439DRAFT_1619792 [Ramaria rubella]|nr:hypothetical protein K439DRAFT_1619792 [Ramaria rubella]
MDDLTSFVNKEVLFEINLDSLGIHYPASHLPNISASEERNSGYGIFAPQSGNIFTLGSAAFLNILHSKGFLILEGEASTITWCTEKALKWLPQITMALEKAFNLVHVLQGPPPRGTEAVLMQLTNSSMAEGNVFLHPGGEGHLPLVKFISKYYKGVANSGVWNWVTRVIPFELSYILWILFDVIRPIETNMVVQCLAHTQEDTKDTCSLFQPSLG